MRASLSLPGLFKTVILAPIIMGQIPLTLSRFITQKQVTYPGVTGELAGLLAQIGLVVLGIFLVIKENEINSMQNDSAFPLLTSTDVSFYKIILLCVCKLKIGFCFRLVRLYNHTSIKTIFP